MTPGYRKILPLGLAVTVLDQIAKEWVVRVLDPGHATAVNRVDMDWQRWFFAAAAVLAVAVILRMAATTRQDSRPLSIALGLILGGALGNLFDRLFRQGMVVDFLDFHLGGHHWPAFNVADSAITVGVVFMLVALYRQR
jgi:signal peptidase II